MYFLGSSVQARLIGALVGWFDYRGGGAGFLATECMECPQVGRGGVFRQITSNNVQTRSSVIALCKSCMNDVEKCFGKGFGWICAINRWSVPEHAHISVCL